MKCTNALSRYAGNVIHAKAQDEGTGQQVQATGPVGNVMVARVLGAVEYGWPLSKNWSATGGVNFSRTRCTDDHGQSLTKVSSSNSKQVSMQLANCALFVVHWVMG